MAFPADQPMKDVALKSIASSEVMHKMSSDTSAGPAKWRLLPFSRDFLDGKEL
jgi:hypothetical protein